MLKRKHFPLIVYSVIWILSVALFWIFVHGDALAYSLGVFFMILPLAALVSSLLMGLRKGWGKRTWCFPLVPAAGHLLADYFTFKLANNLSQHKINTPDWPLLLPGLVCGLIGVILGGLVSYCLRKRKDLA